MQMFGYITMQSLAKGVRKVGGGKEGVGGDGKRERERDRDLCHLCTMKISQLALEVESTCISFHKQVTQVKKVKVLTLIL